MNRKTLSNVLAVVSLSSAALASFGSTLAYGE